MNLVLVPEFGVWSGYDSGQAVLGSVCRHDLVESKAWWEACEVFYYLRYEAVLQ